METRKAAMQAGAVCLKVGIYIMIVLGIIYMGQTTYRYTRAVFCNAAYETAPGTTVRVSIPEDVSSDYLADVLEKQGIVEDSFVLKLQMKMQNFQGTVEAGDYELNTSMKPSEIFAVLSGAYEEETP